MGRCSCGTSRPGRRLRTLNANAGQVHHLTFSPDGHLLAVAFQTGAVRWWNTDTYHKLATVTARQGSINGLAFSPDGRILVTDGELVEGRGAGYARHPTVQLWDTATGHRLAALSPPDAINGPNAFAFSPDGQLLAASMDNTVWLWEVATGRRLAALYGHTAQINSIAFSPNGRMVATSSWDGTLRVWDASTHHLLTTVSSPALRPDLAVESLAFGSDCRTLAGVSAETLHLWDPATGDRLATLAAGEPVAALRFDLEGRLVTISDDGAIRWWDIDADHIVAELCRTSALNLTPQDWARRIPGWPYQAICP